MRPKVARVDRTVSREDCRKLLAACGGSGNAVQGQDRLRACLLLALNGGYGPSELSQLLIASVDLDGGWIDQARGKTGVQHTVALWPETVEALRMVMPKHGQYVFETRHGQRLVYTTTTARHSPIGLQVGRLARAAGVSASLYGLRHTHRSVSGGAGDESAADMLMGHSLPGMRAVYQTVSRDRIRSVSNFVHDWFFDPATA